MGSTEIMRWSNGRFFEIQFQIDPDLYEETMFDLMVFDLVANIGGLALVLYLLLSLLLRKFQTENLQERLLGLLYLYQNARSIQPAKRNQILSFEESGEADRNGGLSQDDHPS